MKLKEFKLEVWDPPNGVYLPGMTVTGVITAVIDIPNNDFKAIQVSVIGELNVRWTVSQTHSNGHQMRTTTRLIQAHVNCINRFVKVWDKEKSGGSSHPVGSYSYPFSIQLVGDNLPTSFMGKHGSIRYTVQARVVRGFQKFDQKVIADINVTNAITPCLIQPSSKEANRTITYRFSPSTYIIIKVSIPRTEYHAIIQNDAIPFSVDVKNNSNHEIHQLTASICKTVVYIVENDRIKERMTKVASISSKELNTVSGKKWCPGPLVIPPQTEATMAYYRYIVVSYDFRVTGSIKWGKNPTAVIPITIGTAAPLEMQPSIDHPSYPQPTAVIPKPIQIQ
jgi:hypothetical protein